MPVKNGKLQRQNRILAGLQQTVADMISELDLQVVLQKAVERTAELVAADIVTIHICDPITGEAHASAGYGLLDRETFQQYRPGRGTVVLAIARRGEIIIAEDVSTSELAGPFAAIERVQSAGGFPLRVGDKVIGVLFVSYREPHVFKPEEIKTIVSFGNLAAVAINTARAYQQAETRAHVISQLNKVGQSLATLQDSPEVLQETLERIANTAIEVLGADTVDLYQYRADRDDFVLPPIMVGERRFAHLVPKQIFPDDVVVKVAHTGEKIFASDAQGHPVLAGEWEGPREERPKERFVIRERIVSSAAAPMKAGEEVLGAMFASYRQKRDFDTDLELRERVEALANFAGVAIQNARLFDEAKRRIQDLEIIDKVGQIISTKLDIQDLLQAIASQIADKLNCTHCTLFFPQKDEGELLLVPWMTHGLRSKQIMERRFKPGEPDEGLVGWAYRKGESLVLPDARADSRFAPARDPQDRPRSMLVIPVRVGDRTIGVISADQDEYGWFSDRDQHLVEALAQQAGIAIEQARGLELLQEIGNRILSPQKVDEILQQIVSGAIELTHTTSGVIYLIGEDGKSVIQSFLYPPGFEHPEPRIGKEEGMTHQVISTGERLMLPDINQDDRVNPALHGRVQSMIAIPLKYKEKVTGVLYLNDEEPHNFTETEQSLLSTLASQAAIAIENARAQERLAQEQYLMHVLMDSIPDAIYFKDLESRFVRVNKAHASERWFNVGDPAQVIGKTDSDFFTEAHAKQAYEDEQVVTRTGRPLVGIEEKETWPDGRETWASTTKMPLRDTEGNIIGTFGISRDISERRQMEEALARERNLLRTVIDNLPDCIYAKDIESRFILSNTATAHLMGKTNPDEVLGKTDSDFFPPELVARYRADEQKVMQSGQPSIGIEEPVVDTSNNVLWSLTTKVPLRDSHGKIVGLVGLNRDITERKKARDVLQERATQLERLQRVTTTISAEPPNLDNVLRLIVIGLGEIFQGASCSIRLYDAKTGEFEPMVATGILEDLVDRPPRHDGTSHYVVHTKTPRYLEKGDLRKPPDGGPAIREDILERGVSAIAYLPLISDGNVVGILYVDLTDLHRFSKDERRILELFADQASIAIENARLFEQLNREKKERIEAIREIGFGITASTDLDKVLDGLLQRTTLLMKEASDGEIWLLDQEAEKLKIRASKGDIEAEITEISVGEGIVGWVAETGKPYLVGNAEGDWQFVRRLGATQSELAVPLFERNRLIGVLNIEHPKLNAFVEDDIPLLEAIASQVVVAIENARLYQNLGRRVGELKVLTKIGQTVSTLKVDKILDLVYEQTSEVMDLGDALFYIAFYDDTRDGVSFGLTIERDNEKEIDKIRWGMRHGEEVKEWMPRARRDPPGLTEYVVRTMQPVLIVQDFDRQAEERGIRVWPKIGKLKRSTQSWLGVPMIAGDQIIGMISIQSLEREHAFDEAHREVLAAVANQAAVAIENARLHATLTQKVEELEQANIDLQAARKQAVRATLSAMAGGYVHRLNGALGFIPASVDTIMNEVSTDVQEVLRDVRGGVAEAIAYTKRMTDLFTGQELPRESVDVNLMLQAVVHKLRIPPSIDVALELESDLPEIMADKMFLTEVFYNIIVNALEAMAGKPKGNLRVGSRLTESDTVETWISDTGCGILEENLLRLFDPDFTTKPGKRGIGLWFCDTVIKVLGGAIDVDSTPNVGTTFTLILPRGD